ncbi:hypothetical protein E3U43_013803 [Larimichthys crocea]|uniref:Uncharacterized protein n=1 Tax=Larimichthys crocea TaxID=215358 RepID=A0ACD3RAU7_LARCR|nr:hypothetical protein E3U43_013803 [Larimichthys crocea]
MAELCLQIRTTTEIFSSLLWVNNPTLGEFCFTMIGRADIEGSKSDVAMNAWPPQASYPCVPVYHPGYFLPLVVCVSLVGVLIAVLLLLYIRKTRRHVTLNSRNMELPVVYKNSAPASTCEDSTNESSKD